MFKHIVPSPLKYDDLSVIEKDGLRHYITPDGFHFPSITTVLSVASDHSGLSEWIEKVGKEYAEKKSKMAATRGTQLHKAIEDYLNNEPFSEKLNYWVLANFKTAKPYLDASLSNIILQEAPLYSRQFGIAGRVDCIAEWNGELSIIDFKTSFNSKEKEWISNYFVQAAFYAAAFFELTDIPIKQSVIFIVSDDEVAPQIFIEPTYKWLRQLLKYKKIFDDKKRLLKNAKDKL
jgi:hypothetical protein